MGLWITHHHAEPLGAELFAREYPDLQANYLQHKQLFHEIWRQGIRSQADCNVIWGLGFRGQGDRPFWEDDPCYDTPEKQGKLISEIIREQYAMVNEEQPYAICCINLYGETLELYRGGYLDLPKDVIYIWADNGYGKMVSRRQFNHNPRIPAIPDNIGRHGVYYHASFYDLQASNHLTMLPNPPDMVCKELSGAFNASAGDYLIVNCGSIRPHCYILDLIAEFGTKGNLDTNTHRKRFVETYFEGEEEIKALLDDFSKHTIRYGPHEDDKAGEEIYHYPVRQLAVAWIRNEQTGPLESLIWLCGNNPFDEQVKIYYDLLNNGRKGWESYHARCEATAQKLDGELARRFYDHIQLQAVIHNTGVQGALLFCESYAAALQGDYPKAFVLAWKAKEIYKQAINGFEKSEHGIWKGYYSNDCLTDVRQTVRILDKLQGWLRIKGEGSDFQLWYRRFLMSEEDRRIVLLMYTQQAPSDDSLACELSKVIL